ncbi:DUF4429 domain-containing protein [Streptoalloteichus hindustanus]|uniref:Short C-terminal domain-containing protein n=1 Tax=Streptoalloteichus hindustanus TaxID=2017 RepID=A0A1M5AKP9_STRHI|nr:DUF4429 domain-containing protein [Streptoalloteichus hindustanus]SHF30858.1 protein of unknown function [Streptoalloteichus hindustanus]
MGMGLELRGQNATWFFEAGAVRVRYATGLRVPALLKELKELVVPDTALAGAAVSAGNRKVTLQMRLRRGACPLLEAAAGQLGEGADPYRLVLRADQADLADIYAEDLRGRAALNPEADRPAERFLLPAPPPPRHVKAYDGEGVFDGSTVMFRWAWSGASSAKWRAGDQVFPVSEIVDVEWAAPGVLSGHLRVRLRGDDPTRSEDPDQDPRALTFGVGYGLTHESLTFAASVLVAIADHRAVAPAPAVAPVPPAPPAALPSAVLAPPPPSVSAPESGVNPDEVIATIRKLGELRDAGLLSDDEFQRKKAELLARL